MNSRRGLANQAFAGTVIVLIIVAAVGFTLYLTKQPATEVMTETTTSSSTLTMTESMTHTVTAAMTQEAISFAPQKGAMIGEALLLIQPTGMTGQYALSIYAPGLETTMGTGNDYLVEGAQMGGSMASAPVTGNVTSSEFEVGSNGVGQFFALLNHNPYTSFENVQIFYLAGMQMSNATLVATATLGSMSSG